MEVIIDFFNQIDFGAIWDLLRNGFLLGALAGVIVGVSVWTLLERGSISLSRVLIGALIGLAVGFLFEGEIVLGFFSQDLESVFGSSGLVRLQIFDTIVILFAYIFCFMGLGAFISNPFRAMAGMLLGAFLGTLGGIIFFLAAPILNLPTQSTIIQALVGILVIIFMGFMSLSDS